MKSKAGLFTGAILVLIAIYTVIWWHQSNRLQDEVTKTLADMSKRDGSSAVLTYDKVVRGGYPLDVDLIFTNPKLVEKESKIEIAHQGTVKIGRAIFQPEKVWVKSEGKTAFNLPKEATGDEDQHYIVDGKIFYKCVGCGSHIHLVNNEFVSDLTLDQWIPIVLSDSLLELKDFSVARSAKEPTDFHDFLKIGKGFIKTKNTTSGGYNKFQVKSEFDKISSAVEYHALAHFKELFPDASDEELKQAFFGFGEGTWVLEAHGAFPTLDNPFYNSPSFGNLPSFSFVLDKLESRDAYAAYTAKGGLSFDRNTDKTVKGMIYADKEVQFTEKLHPKLVDLAKVLGQSIAKNKEMNPRHAAVAQVLVDKAKQLIPDLARLGVIKSVIDLKSYGKTADDPNNLISFNVDLEKLKLESNLFQFNATGKVGFPEDKDSSATFNLQLKQYKELFNALLKYYTRWQTSLQKVKTASQLPVITSKYVERIEQFLQSLSTTSRADELDIRFVYQDPGKAQIGKKSMQEVMMAWTQLMADLKAEFERANPSLKPQGASEK